MVFKRVSKVIWLILIGVYGGIIHGLWGGWLILIWPMWCYNILHFNKLVFMGRGFGFRVVLLVGRGDLLFWSLIVYFWNTRSPLSILYTFHFFQIKVVRKWWGHFWLCWVLAKKCAKFSRSVSFKFEFNMHPICTQVSLEFTMVMSYLYDKCMKTAVTSTFLACKRKKRSAN